MTATRFQAILCAGLLLAACGQAADQSNGAAQNAANGAPATDGPAESSRVSLWNGGKAKPLDVQVAHPNGTVVQLTSLRTQPTATTVGIRVINGRDRDVGLNQQNLRSGYLLLDNGERLYLSPPSSNPKLSIPAGQTFEGELAFLGRLTPAANAAILVLNENSRTDTEYTITPGFRIDLPLAGASQ